MSSPSSFECQILHAVYRHVRTPQDVCNFIQSNNVGSVAAAMRRLEKRGWLKTSPIDVALSGESNFEMTTFGKLEFDLDACPESTIVKFAGAPTAYSDPPLSMDHEYNLGGLTSELGVQEHYCWFGAGLFAGVIAGASIVLFFNWIN